MTRAANLAKIVTDANLEGTLDVTGVLTGTSLDISGDIDVDGTTNLDVVDIDGAVDMASTLTVGGAFTSLGIDDNADAVAMTIDSSENVMIGTTDNSPNNNNANSSADNGISLRGAIGKIEVARYNSIPFDANRTGSDGEILNFRRSGTIVGSIQSRASAMLSIVLNPSGSDGAGFTGGSNAVLPANASALSDNAIDLGVGSYRYKDLYLSGGVFLGGTGSANKLSDVETGTWTPTADGGSTTYSTQSGLYTKIGNIVYAKFNLEINNFAGSVRYLMGGLPFNSFSSGGGSGSILYFANIHTSAVALFTRTDSNGATVFISGTTGSSGTIANINHNWANNSANIIGHIIYQTA